MKQNRGISFSLALLLICAALLLALDTSAPKTETLDAAGQIALLTESAMDEAVFVAGTKNNQNTP